MTPTSVLSYALWGVGLLALASYLVRRRALGNDSSPAGDAIDAALRRQLRIHLIVAVLALAGAALL